MTEREKGFTIWRIPILTCWLFKNTLNFLLHREKSVSNKFKKTDNLMTSNNNVSKNLGL